MTQALQELCLRLLCFARERIDSAEYMEAHHRFVRRTLISWSQEPALQELVPRLLHYCLNNDSLASPIVDLTFQRMASQYSKNGKDRDLEYLERLRIEFAVMDQLNSLPWAYAIRTRNGSDNRWLVPIIEPHVPIDVGCWFSRFFRTTCADQRYIRIELFAGPDTRDRTEESVPLLARRVRLPEGLPRGEKVEVAIQRLGEARMRLELRIPRIDGTDVPWWWIEDSAGFADLAADEARRFREILEKEGAGGGLKPLLTGCLRLLNHPGNLLSERDGNRLAEWVQRTFSALVQRDEEGLENAVRLLPGDLDAVRNESVEVILETLFLTTGAPLEVTMAFERLAIRGHWLAVQVRQEDADDDRVFQALEARPSFRGMRAVVPREEYRRVVPPAWLWQETPEPEKEVAPHDADELLEVMPDEPSAEPDSPLSPYFSPLASSGAWSSASGAGAGDGAASPPR